MPVSRGELVRFRRLLELAQAQRDAVLAGQWNRLPDILAERQCLLNEWPALVDAEPGPSATPDTGQAFSEEARGLLRAILAVDRECERLVAGRLKEVEAELAATRVALQGSRAYRLCLQAGSSPRVLDELK